MNATFYLRYAWRSLVRSGQRSLLGLLCIAFGVLSLVAMQLLAAAVRDGIVVEPRRALGGDYQLTAPAGDVDARLRALQADGVIDAHLLLARTPPLLLRRREGGRVHILARALGVSAGYPLVGRIEYAAGAGDALLERVLASPGLVLLTADAAAALSLEAGDELLAADLDGRRSARLTLAGVVRALPDRQASTMLFGLETARLLAGESAVRAALVLAPPTTTPAQLESAGWRVRAPADEAKDRERVASLFDLMLKGAGLLGLLVGAVGVLNTLYVTLARRTDELATLKALGYGSRRLVAMLGTETLILGLIGSVTGALAGVLVAGQLAGLLNRVEGSLTVLFQPRPGIVLGGIAVGVIMSVVFGLYATVRAAEVRPAHLLRQQPVPFDRAARLRTGALVGVLALTYVAVASRVLGSLPQALATVAATLLLATAFTGLLALALLLLLRLPLPLGRTGMLARRGLGRRPLRAVAALGALAIGIFTISFAAAVLLRGAERLAAEQRPELARSVVLVGTSTHAAAVDAALAQRALAAQVDTLRDATRTGLRWRIESTDAEPLARALERELPDVMVIAGSDIVGFLARSVRGLFTFVAALSALALLAGVVLVANAVGLGLLERRVELALLKALGYSRARVLGTIAAENTLLGLLGSGFGIALAAVAITVINTLRPQAAIALHGRTSALLLVAGVVLCQLTALAVAWRPTSLRPLAALREP